MNVRRWAPRLGATLLIALAGALVAGTLVGEAYLPAATRTTAQPVELAAAEVGEWFCPVTAPGEEALLEYRAVGEEPAGVTVIRQVNAEGVVVDSRNLAPGELVTLPLGPEDAAWPHVVTWRGGPVVARWTAVGDGGGPSAGDVAAATCVQAPAPQFHLAGFDTTRGNTALLHVHNPFESDATVRLQFGTAEGAVGLVIAEELRIPSRRSVVFDLTEFRPEEEDLGVTVTAVAGRMVATGESVLGPAPDVDESVPSGRALIEPLARPVSAAVFALALSDADTSSWLSLYNPGSQPSAAVLRVSDPNAGAQPLTGEIVVGAGATTRVDLSGTSDLSEFGVQLEVANDVPLVATRIMASLDDERRGLVATTGIPTDGRWALIAAGADAASVALYNPSGEPVHVEVDAGPETPSDWAEIALPANSVSVLSLPAGERVGVDVRADAAVAVATFTRSEDTGAFTLDAGLPGALLPAESQGPTVVHDPDLATTPVAPRLTTEPPAVPQLEPGEGGLDPVGAPSEPPDMPTGDDTATPTPTPSDAPTTTAPATTPATDPGSLFG